MTWEWISTELFEALKIKAKALEKHPPGDIQNSTLWNGKNPNSGYVAYNSEKKNNSCKDIKHHFTKTKKYHAQASWTRTQRKAILTLKGHMAKNTTGNAEQYLKVP